jgi:hypothetical protein
MPRYYFHIYDDIDVRDEDGIDFPDLASAERAALDGAREMMCGQVMDGRLNLRHRVEIEDEAGERLMVLPFSDAIRIEG